MADPREFGPHYWYLYEQVGNQLPDAPNRSDRILAKSAVETITRLLPCDSDCKQFTYNYFNHTPLNFDSRKDYKQSLCTFHNAVNKKVGKEERDCNVYTMQDSQCSDCSVKQDSQTSDNVQQIQQGNGVQVTPEPQEQLTDQLKTNLLDYKTLNKKIFEDLCAENHLTPPKILFAPCSTAPNTSCVDDRNKSEVVVYLNPYTLDLRQSLHEFDHYRDSMSGNRALSTENKANTFALTQIYDKFPHDINASKPPQVPAQADNQVTSQVLADGGEPIDPFGKKPLQDKRKPKKDDADVVRASQPIGGGRMGAMEGFEERFPYYSMVLKEQQEKKIESEVETRVKEKSFISYLDAAYTFPAGFVNLTPSELNLAHTPQVLKSVISTLMESNLSPLGSALASSLLGLVLFISGYFVRNHTGTQDRMFIQMLSASFFWNTLRYINPKELHRVKHEATELKHRVSEGQYGSLKELLWEPPGKFKEMWGGGDNKGRSEKMGPEGLLHPDAFAGATMLGTGGRSPVPIDLNPRQYGGSSGGGTSEPAPMYTYDQSSPYSRISNGPENKDQQNSMGDGYQFVGEDYGYY